MRNLIKRLEKRGWEKKEIDKAIGIIQKAKSHKKNNLRFFEKQIYFLLLLLIIGANFAISIALIPVLIALRGIPLYSVIVLLGFVFGLLFELLIRTIEHLEARHHIILAVFIPFTALANVYVISKISNDLMHKLNILNAVEPLSVAIAYSVSFVVPYLLYRFAFKIEYYAKE